jgi:hypothetical protein
VGWLALALGRNDRYNQPIVGDYSGVPYAYCDAALVNDIPLARSSRMVQSLAYDGTGWFNDCSVHLPPVLGL